MHAHTRYCLENSHTNAAARYHTARRRDRDFAHERASRVHLTRPIFTRLRRSASTQDVTRGETVHSASPVLRLLWARSCRLRRDHREGAPVPIFSAARCAIRLDRPSALVSLDEARRLVETHRTRSARAVRADRGVNVDPTRWSRTACHSDQSASMDFARSRSFSPISSALSRYLANSRGARGPAPTTYKGGCGRCARDREVRALVNESAPSAPSYSCLVALSACPIRVQPWQVVADAR